MNTLLNSVDQDSQPYFTVTQHAETRLFLNSLFKLITKKRQSMCITGSLWGNPPVTAGSKSRKAFPCHLTSCSGPNTPLLWSHSKRLEKLVISQTANCRVSFLLLVFFLYSGRLWIFACYVASYMFRWRKYMSGDNSKIYNWEES